MATRSPLLTLRPETAFFIVLKTREFHMKVEEVDADEGSNPTDDGDTDVLKFNPGDHAAVGPPASSAFGPGEGRCEI